MMGSLSWKIGKISAALYSERNFPAVELPEGMQQFIVNHNNKADIEIYVHEEPVPVPNKSDLLFDSGSLWQAYRWADGVIYTFKTPDGKNRLGRGLWIALDSSECILFLPPSPWNDHKGYAILYPLAELLFQHFAARNRALVIHACGIEYQERVLLFCGQSGAGKTTIANLWRSSCPDANILSDDRILLEIMNGKFFGFGTPWHGEGIYASPNGFSVAAVFFIHHGHRFIFEPLPRPMAAADLMACSFYPPWDADAIGQVIQTSAKVISQCHCAGLSFFPDYSLVEEVLSFIEKKSL